jgi:hypothetical protein
MQSECNIPKIRSLVREFLRAYRSTGGADILVCLEAMMRIIPVLNDIAR